MYYGNWARAGIMVGWGKNGNNVRVARKEKRTGIGNKLSGGVG